MDSYAVWAPKADQVDLVLAGFGRTGSGGDSGADCAEGERRIAMTPGEGGWFTSAEPVVEGQRYGYSVDGSPVFPDPRSRRQPDSIHGLSQVWTHPALRPSEPTGEQHARSEQHAETAQRPRPLGRPLRGEVLYELHIGTFTPEGTFDGAIAKLDYLRKLGVTAVELMPVQPFGGARNWGYDGVSWHAVHEGYGGPDGLARFITAAHERELAVILDVVYNHFGPDGNYTGIFGPYTAGGSTGWGETVNLNQPDSDEVRRYILDAVRIWTQEFGVDGLRLDAVHAYDDTGAVSIMEQMRQAAAPSYLIAESDQNDPKITERFGLAQWNDDLHHAIHAAVSGETDGYYADFGSVEALAAVFRRVFYYDGRYSSFRRRTHGRALTDPEPWRFVVYTTTHDQTGNRARGDRPSMNLSPAQQMLKAVLVLTSPFTPMLFMGEEWGASTPFAFFVDHEDPELNRLTREGRLREFEALGWRASDVPAPEDPETFRRSTLVWGELEEPPHAAILAGYRELLRFRKENRLAQAGLPVVRTSAGSGAETGHSPEADFGPGSDGADRWIELTYRTPVSTVFVVANLSADPVSIPVSDAPNSAWADLGVDASHLDPAGQLRLGPWGTLFWAASH
ncbi:malto-oligosyltrehalose trehalohydrolase [Corynebacterium heidelbergense]|uniref:Malto-oligosyltrehalose trehalohydrolase n=1 Tax=Corynebacterium heidelbergense TaxID=2055947 RepID=A0A364V7V2_9CORY|nr:malto-oligosyltrehalose trehalohydrolase [Corynebacterium heidelbergense]RAV32646.1 malto-oligosyltrehalose trehalohydrolase [Corynebacterium heidelbergense]